MAHRSALVRRAGIVAVALGLAVGTTAAPTLAKQAGSNGGKTVDCTDYGKLAKAPKGAIPRDDQHVVKHDPLLIEAAEAAQAAKGKAAKASAAELPGFDADFQVTVPVRFHEILKTQGNGGGDLSDARLQAQVDALNEGYAGTGFTFTLDRQGSTETVQPEWFNLIAANGAEPRYFRGGGKEVAMKQQLHSDDPEVLDVYTASLGQSLLGWAYFPSDFTSQTSSDYGPLHDYFDGVVIDFRTLPVVEGDTDGDQRVFPPGTYEQGDTLTHEVGHWLELYHTFQGGCPDNPSYREGDQVDDTPAEASPNFLCPAPGEEPRDTCPDDPGNDPVNNFMDYSFDSCLTEFTTGQAARMQFAWETYRANKS
jgi:hypothetical protein